MEGPASSVDFSFYDSISVVFHPVHQLPGYLMQLPAAFRLLFPCKGGDALCQFPECCPSCYAVVGVVVHQVLFDFPSFVFQQRATLYQGLKFLVKVHVYVLRSLNFDGFLHVRILAVKSFSQIFDS